MLNRILVIIPLAIPLCGYSQGYLDHGNGPSGRVAIESASPDLITNGLRSPGSATTGMDFLRSPRPDLWNLLGGSSIPAKLNTGESNSCRMQCPAMDRSATKAAA